MTTALLYVSQDFEVSTLPDDLRAAGIAPVLLDACTLIVQHIGKSAPDVVIIADPSPDSAMFECTRAIAANNPQPVIMFTADPDAEKIDLATRSGIHAYVVNGYSRGRLRSIVHLAQARFRHEQGLRGELTDLNQRFSERKLVDRAKGILMGARQLREEEAYSALRNAAMRSKRRIGQVSRQIIDGARYAEAVNRAGQLRMLSQRLVKLYALAATATRPEETAGLHAESIAHVDANLAILGRSLSKPTFGDLLAGVVQPWDEMRRALGMPPDPATLPKLDRLAEDLLEGAELLTTNLEVSGYAAALHVINVSGRQRMLSQRIAKQALLAALLPGPEAQATRASMAETAAAIGASLDYLTRLPLSNAAIATELHATGTQWAQLQHAVQDAGTSEGRDVLAVVSEALLATLERLTAHLERGIQALVV